MENYESLSTYDNKVEGLVNNDSCSKYFYVPSKEGIGGLKYVIDRDGHALYLIKKSELPNEVKDGLVEGDAGDKTYIDYKSLNDVYGVTSQLKVYYCSKGIDSIMGMAKENIDNDNPQREVFDKEKNATIYGLIDEYDKDNDGIITATESRKIDSIQIDENTVDSLSDLYNLVSLKNLTLNNVALNSLDGIQNVNYLEYIAFINYDTNKIGNYEHIKTVKNLKYLYLINSNDNQVDAVFESTKDIEYSNLEYLGVYDSGAKVTNISKLASWKEETKKKVKYLYFYNNQLTDISCFEDFSNVIDLRCQSNKIISLTPACNNMNNLQIIYANDNALTDNKEQEQYALKSFDGKTKLSQINLQNNVNLIYIGFLKGTQKCSRIYLSGCPNFLGSEVALIANLYYSTANHSIDDKFKSYLSSAGILEYGNANLKNDSDQITYLKTTMSKENCDKVKAIRIQGNKELSNETLQAILVRFPNIESINVNDCNLLSSLDFVKQTPKLAEILFKNTAVKDLTPLNSITTIKCIECNNSNFNNNSLDITTIQPTLSRLVRDHGNANCYYETGGMMIGDLASQLSSCTNLTYIELSGLNYSRTIDLSKVKTENVYVGTFSTVANKIILPSSIGQLRFNRNNMLDYSSCKSIQFLMIETMNAETSNSLAEVCYNIEKYKIKVDRFTWLRPGYVTGENTYTNTFTNETTVGISFGNLINKIRNSGVKKIEIAYSSSGDLNNVAPTIESEWHQGSYSYTVDLNDLDFSTGFENLEYFVARNVKLNSLSCFSGCTSLKSLWVVNSKVQNIDGLENCTQLKRLILNNNQITNINSLKDLKNLFELNLENNALFVKENDINNMEIIAKLNGYALKKIYLQGNIGIDDYSDISGLTWTAKSGF